MEEFTKIPIEPTPYSTVNSRKFFTEEVHTTVPNEFKFDKRVKLRWKVVRFPSNIKYDFIIGTDIFKKLGSIINLQEGLITINNQNIPFLADTFENVQVLEIFSEAVDSIDISHLKKEEKFEMEKLLDRFKTFFF